MSYQESRFRDCPRKARDCSTPRDNCPVNLGQVSFATGAWTATSGHGQGGNTGQGGGNGGYCTPRKPAKVCPRRPDPITDPVQGAEGLFIYDLGTAGPRPSVLSTATHTATVNLNLGQDVNIRLMVGILEGNVSNSGLQTYNLELDTSLGTVTGFLGDAWRYTQQAMTYIAPVVRDIVGKYLLTNSSNDQTVILLGKILNILTSKIEHVIEARLQDDVQV